MLACACCGQILDGRIEDVTAENADPHVVAALVFVGVSKGSVLKRDVFVQSPSGNIRR